MFEKGEYIICNNVGVCRVEDITSKDMMQDKLCYILQPLDLLDSKIYSAVDNKKMAMRRILSRDEISTVLDQLGDIDVLSVDNEKKREEVYKETLYKCDCIGWAKIIKTIYTRKKEKAKQGKKMTAVDSKYLKKAEDFLYREIAISMELEPDDAKERVLSEIGVELTM